MQRAFSTLLSVHWLVFFTMLAATHVADVGATVPDAVGAAGPLDGSWHLALGVGAFFVAALFLWAALCHLAHAAPETRLDLTLAAHGGAILFTTAVAAGGVLSLESGWAVSSLAQVGALAASCAAILLAEKVAALEGGSTARTARFMAVSAAHSSILPRLVGRAIRDN